MSSSLQSRPAIPHDVEQLTAADNEVIVAAVMRILENTVGAVQILRALERASAAAVSSQNEPQSKPN